MTSIQDNGRGDLDALVQRAAAGYSLADRQEAFGEIVRRFQDMAYGCALGVLGDSHQAQDAAQEAFLAAWRELERLRAPAAFPGWFRRIVLTQCGRITRRPRVSTVPLEDALALPGDCDPAWELERQHDQEQVRSAIHGLPELERVAISLFYLSDYSQREVAVFLGVPVTTVQKRLFTARKRLREQLAPPPERILAMVQDELQNGRPSRDDRFANAIQLFNAAAAGDAGRVRSLLERDPGVVHERHKGQWGDRTPLDVAAEQGHAAIVELLLQHGADVGARDDGDHATPLHWAAEGGHLATARILLDHGADANAADDVHERGPLGWAVALSQFRPDMADLLIERGARVDIFAAIALQRETAVRELVTGDPDRLAARMSPCEDSQTPLHFAVTKDRPQMVDLLLALGADLNSRTPSGKTALCRAVEEEKEAAAEILRARGAEVDLLTAIAMDRSDLAMALLDGGVESALLGPALLAAAHHGRQDVAECLTVLGADLDWRGQCDWMRGVTPLSAAANRSHSGIASLLLQRGADATLRDEYPGATALHYAAWNGNVELIDLLLRRGADIDVKDGMYEADPIGWAIENRQNAAVDLFLERGAVLDISRAAYLGRVDLVRSILDRDPSVIDFRGGYGTALHQAALHGFTEIVELLLEHGAGTSLPNRHGDTALTVVRKALKGLVHPSNLPAHPEIEALLLRHGAAE